MFSCPLVGFSGNTSGQTTLQITWYGRAGIASVQLQVTPTNNPDMTPAASQCAEVSRVEDSHARPGDVCINE